MKPLEERFHSMMKPRATATDIQAVIVEIDAEVARLGVAADLPPPNARRAAACVILFSGKAI